MAVSVEHMREAHGRIKEKLLRSSCRYIVVLSALTAITYIGALRPPQPLGSAYGRENRPPSPSPSQTFFFFFNAFSFFSSAFGLLLAVSCSIAPLALASTHGWISTEQEAAAQMKDLATMIPEQVYMAIILAFSTMSCAAAFLFAVLARTSNEEGLLLKLPLIIPCAVGMCVVLQALSMFLQEGVRFLDEIRSSHELLWRAVKRQTATGKVLDWYMKILHGKVKKGGLQEPEQFDERKQATQKVPLQH